jgi:hypothetical protein
MAEPSPIASESRHARIVARGTSGTLGPMALSMAYYEVLSLMHEQAIAFDLPLLDLSRDGLDPERDLL